MEHAAKQGLLTRAQPVLCKPNKQVGGWDAARAAGSNPGVPTMVQVAHVAQPSPTSHLPLICCRTCACAPATCRQAFELVLAQLGCAPANAMFIDDSPRNTAAARELGLLTVLVSPAAASQQQQHQAQQPPCADLVVPSFEALQTALPQLFECAERRVSSPAAGEAAEELPAGVPVRVMAS